MSSDRRLLEEFLVDVLLLAIVIALFLMGVLP